MLNQNPMKMESSRLLSFLEREVLAKLHRLVYRQGRHLLWPRCAKDAALGVMTSGGTIANVTALWLARNRACGDNLFALAEQGYRGAVILGSRLMHYSFDKGMDLLGLGARSVWRLTPDEQTGSVWRRWNRPFNKCREQKLKVLALVGVAGSTGFLALSTRCRNWPPSPGASKSTSTWTRPGVVRPSSPRYQGLLDGDRARRYRHPLTVTKQLLVPLGTGMLLCRQPDLMMTVKREALRHPRHLFSIRAFHLEGTRPANALYLDAAFQMLGQQVMPNFIDANYDRRAANGRSSTPAPPSS